MLRSLSLFAASLALAAGVTAQQRQGTDQPVLMLGPPAAARSLPGILGRLELVPLVTRPVVPGKLIIEQIRTARRTVPALVGAPVSAQVLFRDSRGRLFLSPLLTVGDDREQLATARTLDERGSPPDPRGTAREQEPEETLLDPADYPPVPLEIASDDSPPAPEGRPVTYDMRTGRITTSPPGTANLLRAASDFVRGSGGKVTGESELDLMLRDNYSSHQLVGSYTAFPWRVNVKVFLTGIGSCSGTLIDPQHVLIAGHCVHTGGRNGKWATGATIIPAYNGDKPAGAGREPYGTARAVQLHSWTGWTVNRDSRHDLAVIDLDRPIGALTGWFGYGYNTNCSFFTTPTWHNASYPGEDKGGRRMYYKFGDFDACPSVYEAHYNGKARKGESGSGHYKIINGNRIVEAVMSHRHGGNGVPSGATRWTKTKFDHIGGFLKADRPTSCDRIPMDTRGSSSVIAGNRLTSFSWLAHNYSRVSCTGKVSFEVRLSTNTTISTADRLLGIFNYTATTSALGSTRVTHSGTALPLVPSSVSPGTYYLGIIIKTADAKSSNNATHPQEVHKILVNKPHRHGTFASLLPKGCSGTLFTPVAGGTGHPDIGNRISWVLTRARSNAIAVGQVAASPSTASLSTIGGAPCFILRPPFADVRLMTSSFGAARIDVTIPRDTRLIGGAVYVRFVVVDPGAPRPLKLATSQTLQTTVGG